MTIPTDGRIDLDVKALEAAVAAFRASTFNALTLDECKDAARTAITAYLAALPPQSTLGEPLVWWVQADGETAPHSNHDLFVSFEDANIYAAKQQYNCQVVPLAVARRAASPSEQGEAVGEAGTMPGTDGFTMAVFRAADVPVGTKLYHHPAPAAGVKAEAIRNAVLSCRHTITAEEIVLRRSETKPGNALNQLHQRILSALDQGEPK